MQEAKQLLLFGASKGGETFIRKNPNQKINALDHNFQVPLDYEEFLTFMYGN